MDSGETQRMFGADIDCPKGWYSRGYLPHFDKTRLIQSITFRLADSLPDSVLAAMQHEILKLPAQHWNLEKRKRIEHWLDQGLGCCALGHPEVAGKVQEALLHFHGQRYQLLAWCIMPNHVHVMVDCREPLAKIVHGWKSFTSKWALSHNHVLKLGIPDANHFWLRDYWDRFIRDEDHFVAVANYILNNPVKAGLCGHAEDWTWSSAGWRLDGEAWVKRNK